MNLQERSYCDQILRVDLTSGKFEVTPLPGDDMPLILGGKGLGAWLLFNEQSPDVEPLSPENRVNEKTYRLPRIYTPPRRRSPLRF